VDAAHKATLMSAIAFGIPCSSTRPTSKASPSWSADIRYAEQLGYRIKLLGITSARAGHRAARAPTLIPAKRLIANVEGAMNACWCRAMPWAPRCTTARAPAPSRPPRP
jgi:homoserine dehydrogenase